MQAAASVVMLGLLATSPASALVGWQHRVLGAAARRLRPRAGRRLHPSLLGARMASSAGGGDQQQPAKQKPSQGDLVAAALRVAPSPLTDIGINLMDTAFDKAGALLPAAWASSGKALHMRSTCAKRFTAAVPARSQDRDAVIERAVRANVRRMILTGTCLRTSRAAQKMCEAQAAAAASGCAFSFTAGVHPHTAKACDASTIGHLRQLAASPHCVAIGECGECALLLLPCTGARARCCAPGDTCPPAAVASQVWISTATSAHQTCRRSGLTRR